MRFLWITFEQNFSPMISTLKIGDPDKVVFSYISVRASHSLSAHQAHASNQPYKRLSESSAPKVFEGCKRRAVGCSKRGFFRGDATCIANAARFQRSVDDFQNQAC